MRPSRLDTIIIFSARHRDLADFYRTGLRLGDPQHAGDRHIGFPLEGGIYLGFDLVDADETRRSADDTRRSADDTGRSADDTGRSAAEAGRSAAGVSPWFDVDDLQATFDRFVAAGAGVRYPPQPMAGSVLASLYDPDGNVFGLVDRAAG